MSENGARRRPRVLSPETKWEILLEVTSREMTQADAARKWQVDVSTIIGLRRAVKDAALAALATRRGRPAKERNWELERALAASWGGCAYVHHGLDLLSVVLAVSKPNELQSEAVVASAVAADDGQRAQRLWRADSDVDGG